MAFKIRAKLIIAFFVMLIPFSIFAWLTNLAYSALHSNSVRMNAFAVEIDGYAKIQLMIDMLLMPPNDYLITGDVREKENFIELADGLENLLNNNSKQIAEMQAGKEQLNLFERIAGIKTLVDPSDELRFLNELKEGVQKIEEQGNEIFRIRRPVGSVVGGDIMEEMDALAQSLITTTIAQHAEIDRLEFAETLEASSRMWVMAGLMLISAFGVAIVSGIGFAILYSRSFVKPIKALHNGTEKIAEGELDYRISIHTGDEIEQLGKAFNVMSGKLEEFYYKLEEMVQERTRDLQVEKDKFINVLNTMNDGVYICNQSYDVVYVNPVLEREFGQYQGCKCYKYFHDRSEVCPWCPNQEVWAGKAVHWEWYSSKNDRTYDLMDTPLRNPDGSVDKLEIFRDITDSKKAEEELKQRIDELERFQAVAVQREFRIKELRDKVVELESIQRG